MHRQPDPSTFTRRDLLRQACAAALMTALVPHGVAGEPPPARRPTAKHVIYLYLSGGLSHLDSFDPKDVEAVRGPTQAIATDVDGVRVAEHLPSLAQRMHRVCLIRSMTSDQGAHEPGSYLMHTSFKPRGSIVHPALGAWIAALSGPINRTIPANVVIGAGSAYPGVGYLDPQFAPLLLGRANEGLPHSRLPNKVDEATMRRRTALLRAIDDPFEQAAGTTAVRAYRDAYERALAVMSSSDLAAFDIAAEPPRAREAYGDTPAGQGCLLARRLVEHGVRYVEVDFGGWDHHADIFDHLPTQAATLDRCLAALLDDLAERGMLDETLVVLGTEFGRSPEINLSKGRDHHPKAFSCLLAGGGVRGGRVHGSTDETGTIVADAAMRPADLNATIAYALGLPFDQVVHSSSGRPFRMADTGRPRLELFA